MATLRHEDATARVDPDRITIDSGYRAQVARALLEKSDEGTDHVELRRLAQQVFPVLASPRSAAPLAQLVGSAATLRQVARDAAEPAVDRIDLGLARKPSHPIDYPARYGDLDAETRALLIGFCQSELDAGNEGRDALQHIDQRHGWPYSDRTFYVGPWKAARLRRRKQAAD